MGSCLSRSSFTVNKHHTTESIRTYPVLFSMTDAEGVLGDSDTGTYLLYKDYESDKIYLSVRLSNRVRHHRISEVNRLFYLEKQPYPYLDSIIFYHRRHKLRGIRLKQQAHLSARVVKAFSHKIAAANGNLPDHHPHSHPPSSSSTTLTPRTSSSHRVSRSGSLTSLITSSSDSTTATAHGQRL
ncbi:uncharacterized protein [Littorina saxatilis]|uniref:SH2 domain-containing protein n=1 Tax=Littorina saxatilis TaxID=31220 RepID=A0AAN9G911_9CAEN